MMRKSGMILLASALVLTSCGAVRESRMNPFNWFGKSRSTAVAAGSVEEVNPLIPARRRGLLSSSAEKPDYSQPIDTIAELAVERRTGGGAIVRVRGVAAALRVSEARLVPVEEETTDSTLVYELRYLAVGTNVIGGTEAQRSVTVATSLSAKELTGVRKIVVRGARNERSTRR